MHLQNFSHSIHGAISILRWCLTRIGIPIIKVRWSQDCLIFIMGMPILKNMGAVSIWSCCVISIGIPIIKIIWSQDHLILILGIPLPGNWSLFWSRAMVHVFILKQCPGGHLNYTDVVFPGIPVIKMRWSYNHLVFIMGSLYLERQSLYWNRVQASMC